MKANSTQKFQNPRLTVGVVIVVLVTIVACFWLRPSANKPIAETQQMATIVDQPSIKTTPAQHEAVAMEEVKQKRAELLASQLAALGLGTNDGHKVSVKVGK